MDKSFSWANFDRMAKGLEALGILLAVFGPVAGIVLLIFGGLVMKLAGIGVILASLLISLYHFSFSLLMGAIRDLHARSEAESRSAIEVE